MPDNDRWPCLSCGKKVRLPYRLACAECGHTWPLALLLVWHSALLWWRLDRRIRIRRARNIRVCPCCAHDL